MKAIITTLILTLVSTFVSAQMDVTIHSANPANNGLIVEFTETADYGFSAHKGETDTLVFDANLWGTHTVMLLDATTGVQITTDVEFTYDQQSDTVFMNTNDLPAGEYVIAINCPGTSQTCKLTIENGYLGINEASLEDVQLSVFPNPVVDYVTVRFTTENNDVPVNVYTLGGQLVYTDASNRFAGANDVTVDFSSFNTGIYLVKVGGSTFKVIKN